MKISLIFVIAFLLTACNNLPKTGWYNAQRSEQKVFVEFTGGEEDVNAKFPSKFVKHDFVSADTESPSARFLSAGRPKYYAVLSDNPNSHSNMRIITVEVLERDYQPSK